MSGTAEAVGAEIIAMPAAASIPSAIFFMKSPPLSDYRPLVSLRKQSSVSVD